MGLCVEPCASLYTQVHEYYADYFAIGSDLFSVNMPLTFSLFGDSWGDAENAKFNRICDSLLSLALSLKTRPVVRYQGQELIGTSSEDRRHES